MKQTNKPILTQRLKQYSLGLYSSAPGPLLIYYGLHFSVFGISECENQYLFLLPSLGLFSFPFFNPIPMCELLVSSYYVTLNFILFCLHYPLDNWFSNETERGDCMTREAGRKSEE